MALFGEQSGLYHIDDASLSASIELYQQIWLCDNISSKEITQSARIHYETCILTLQYLEFNKTNPVMPMCALLLLINLELSQNLFFERYAISLILSTLFDIEMIVQA